MHKEEEAGMAKSPIFRKSILLDFQISKVWWIINTRQVRLRTPM